MKTNGLLTFLVLPICCLVFVTGCSKQAKKQRHLKRADAYYQAKEFRKAEVEYLNVLRFEPANAPVIQRLATIYYDRGDIRRAFQFLMRSREVDPNNLDSRTKLGNILLAGGQADKAREEALAVLDRNPASDEALLLLTDSSRTAKDIADAQTRLSNLQAQHGNKAAWHLAQAHLHMRATNMPAALAQLGKALELAPNSPYVHTAWGVFHGANGQITNAIASFTTAADLAADNPSLRLRVVTLQFASGATNEGSHVLEQLVKKHPDYTAAWIFRARVAFAEQNLEAASEIVERVLVGDPANFEARLLRATLRRSQGKLEQAIKELDELKRLYPGSPDVSFQLALAHLRKRDSQAALASLQHVLTLNPNATEAILLLAELNLQKGDSATAVRSLEQLVRKQPGTIRAYILLASAYTAERRFDDAIGLYARLSANSPTNAAIPFLTGLTLRQQGKNDQARLAFDRALQLAPDDLLVSYQLVELELLAANYLQASNRVAGLISKHPKSPGAKFLEARIFFAQTNMAAAETALQTTLDWDPNFISAYDLLVNVYVASNKLPQAITNLHAILQRNPKSLSALMLLASIHDQRGELNKAVAVYKNTLSVSPQFVPALNNLGYLLSAKLNNLDEAYQYALKAHDLAPQHPSIADTLGWICFRKRDFNRALLLLQESALQMPGQPEVQFHLGMVQYTMGNEEAATAAFRQSMESTRNYPGRAEASNCLALLTLDTSKPTPQTLAALHDRLKVVPDDVPALLRLGRCYGELDQLDKARELFEQARKANPLSVRALLDLVRSYARDPKQNQQALALAREARKLAPEDPKVAHILGRLALELQDSRWGYSLLQQSAEKQPNNPDLLFDLALAEFTLGRIAAAEATAQRVATAKDFQRRAELQWFLTLVDLSKSAEKRLQSEQQIFDALKVTADYVPLVFVAALIHEQRGRFPDARDLHGQILRRADFPPSRKHLARLYTDAFNDQQKAFDLAIKAREGLPDDADLAKTLGKIAYRRNDDQSALRFLGESDRNRPDDAETLFYLGAAHCRRKESQQAKQALTRALTLSPSASFADEAKRLLATAAL